MDHTNIVPIPKPPTVAANDHHVLSDLIIINIKPPRAGKICDHNREVDMLLLIGTIQTDLIFLPYLHMTV